MKLLNVLSNVFSIDIDHVSIKIEIIIFALPSPNSTTFWTFRHLRMKSDHADIGRSHHVTNRL